MIREKELIVAKQIITDLALLALLTAVAFLAPFLKNQILTGTIVNAALFSATVLFDKKRAFLVGVLPSVFALAVGLLLPSLSFMLPLIIAANMILISVFDGFRKKSYWFGALLASFSKFCFLFFSSFVLSHFLSGQALQSLAAMMGAVQLITALLGSFSASVFLKAFYFK